MLFYLALMIKWFSTPQIKLFEQVFQSLGGARNGNLPLDKLPVMMRLCKAMPTQQQVLAYQEEVIHYTPSNISIDRQTSILIWRLFRCYVEAHGSRNKNSLDSVIT